MEINQDRAPEKIQVRPKHDRVKSETGNLAAQNIIDAPSNVKGKAGVIQQWHDPAIATPLLVRFSRRFITKGNQGLNCHNVTNMVTARE